MNGLHDLKRMICEKLEEYADGTLTRETLDVIDTLAHAGKNIAKLIEDGDGGSFRGSYDGPWSGGANGRENSFRGSYGRDSMGRYSRRSYAGGYSGSNAEFAEELRKMGMNLPENFRGEILRMADKMEQMQG